MDNLSEPSGKKEKKFLFRCDNCNMILSVAFDTPEDLADIQQDKVVLECPCEGRCYVLRN